MKATKRSTKISGGFSLKTFDAAPQGFNPLNASKTTLMRHGIVPKPDAKKDPELYKAWHAVYSKELHHIVPEFKINEDKRNRAHTGKKTISDGTATSTNWSGSVANPPAGDTIKWVTGNWIVPDVVQPPGQPTGSWYYTSAWVGIDGWGSPDVLQAGTSQDVLVQGTSVSKRIYAWWEWYPNYEMQISNFPVSTGDYMTCLICPSTATTATIYLTNNTTGTHTSFQITAPSGTVLKGNCAEWIVEAPSVGGSITKLAAYGATFFDVAYAYSANKVQLNAGTGNTINMINAANKVISQSTIVGPQTIKTQFETPS